MKRFISIIALVLTVALSIGLVSCGSSHSSEPSSPPKDVAEAIARMEKAGYNVTPYSSVEFVAEKGDDCLQAKFYSSHSAAKYSYEEWLERSVLAKYYEAFCSGNWFANGTEAALKIFKG